jgi:hypothetical protein
MCIPQMANSEAPKRRLEKSLARAVPRSSEVEFQNRVVISIGYLGANYQGGGKGSARTAFLQRINPVVKY